MAHTTTDFGAAQLCRALTVDLDFVTQKQLQCSEAMRALAALTLRVDHTDPAPELRPNDLAALFAVMADQSTVLAMEARDHLATVRRLIA
jgi:hypothetical protein